MSLRIITLPGIKKARFAVGLDWRHFDAKPREKELRMMGAERGTWASVRESVDGVWQAGFSRPAEKIKLGAVYPLAALLADGRAQPWRGIFDLGDDLFWYIAVRDDHAIVPDGDVVGTFDEVASVRSQQEFYGAWNEWEGRADLAALAEAVQAYTAKKPVLRSVAHASWIAPAIIGGVALSIAAGGGVAWHLYQKRIEQEKIAALVRQQAMQAALEHERSKSVVLPWVSQANPDAAMGACATLWDAQPLAVAGWALSDWSCQINGMTANSNAKWNRAGGVAQAAPGILAAGGDQSTSNASAPIPPSGAGSPDILPTDQAQRAFWTLMQAEGFKAQLSAVPVIQPLPGEKPKPLDPWVIQSVQISLPAPPWALGMVLDRAVPGLRLSSLTSGAQGWTMTGQLFSSRMAPSTPLQPGTHPIQGAKKS